MLFPDLKGVFKAWAVLQRSAFPQAYKDLLPELHCWNMVSHLQLQWGVLAMQPYTDDGFASWARLGFAVTFVVRPFGGSGAPSQSPLRPHVVRKRSEQRMVVLILEAFYSASSPTVPGLRRRSRVSENVG